MAFNLMEIKTKVLDKLEKTKAKIELEGKNKKV